MKRVFLSIVAICLLAGQASADLTSLTLDAADVLSFHGMYPDTANVQFWGATLDPVEYEADSMLGEVGFTGLVKKGYSITIGATAGELGLTGQSYNGFDLFLANDNDDPWMVTLFVQGLTSLTPVNLGPGTGQNFAWDFGQSIMLAADTFIGFKLESSISRTDVFHVSAVPLPVGVVLGVLGLGVAGLKLRKFM